MSEPHITGIVHRNEKIDGEPFALVVETHHGSVTAITAVHSPRFGHSIGGVRFVEQGTLSELGHLSSSMTDKCLIAGLLAGGQKSLVICPQGIPATYQEQAALLAAHMRLVVDVSPGTIFGPDMNCPEAVMDLVADNSALAGNVTGLGRAHGGLAIDANGYTGHGLAIAVAAAMAARTPPPRTAIVQGFGAVGVPIAQALAELGVEIRGISTVEGAIIADIGGLDPRVVTGATWDGDLRRLLPLLSPGAELRQDPDELLAQRADMFVPAARTMVLARQDELAAARQENPNARSVEKFLAQTGVQMVVEGANYPLSHRAEAFLEQHGVLVLPDVMVNLGGLVGCFFEWAYRREILASPEGFDGIGAAAREFIRHRIEANVRHLLASPRGCRSALGALIAAQRQEAIPHDDLGDGLVGGLARRHLAPWVSLGVR